MFDPESLEFNFMDRSSTDGMTENFDRFVGTIDKVKNALTGLRDSEQMGYNDFYNLIS